MDEYFITLFLSLFVSLSLSLSLRRIFRIDFQFINSWKRLGGKISFIKSNFGITRVASSFYSHTQAHTFSNSLSYSYKFKCTYFDTRISKYLNFQMHRSISNATSHDTNKISNIIFYVQTNNYQLTNDIRASWADWRIPLEPPQKIYSGCGAAVARALWETVARTNAEVVRFQKTGSSEFKRHSTTRRQQITRIVIPADSRQPSDHDVPSCCG